MARCLRGQALVEFALITPILLAMILGLMWMGLAFYDRLNLYDVASRGLRVAHGDCTTATDTTRALLSGREVTRLTCVIEGSLLRLDIGHDLPLPLGGAWPIDITLYEPLDSPSPSPS